MWDNFQRQWNLLFAMWKSYVGGLVSECFDHVCSFISFFVWTLCIIIIFIFWMIMYILSKIISLILSFHGLMMMLHRKKWKPWNQAYLNVPKEVAPEIGFHAYVRMYIAFTGAVPSSFSTINKPKSICQNFFIFLIFSRWLDDNIILFVWIRLLDHLSRILSVVYFLQSEIFFIFCRLCWKLDNIMITQDSCRKC